MDEKYFNDARTMFLTDGWKTFVDEIEAGLNAITLDGCNSTEEFWIAKGRLEAFRQFAGYENAVLLSEDQYNA